MTYITRNSAEAAALVMKELKEEGFTTYTFESNGEWFIRYWVAL